MDPASTDGIFEYPPFEDVTRQIRLLHFHKDTEDSDLVCTLEVYYLPNGEQNNGEPRSVPAYRAISYTWGGQSPSERIWVNGVKVLVTENCRQTLWQAYLLAEAVPADGRTPTINIFMPVFIDAICINQSDKDEKGAQVQIMAKIFDNAQEILICPGWDGEESESFLEGIDTLLQILEDEFSRRTSNLKTSPGSSQSDITWEARRSALHACVTGMTYQDNRMLIRVLKRFLLRLEDVAARVWVSRLHSFSNLNYWSRAWTIQEIVQKRPRLVMSGSRIMKLETIELVLEVFYCIDSDDWHSEMAREVEQLFYDLTGASIIDFQEDLHEWRMFDALQRVSQWSTYSDGSGSGDEPRTQYIESDNWRMELLGCREPRDRVYCLLNILAWRACTGPPNSSYEISSTQVVLETFRRIHGSDIWQAFNALSKLMLWLELDWTATLPFSSPKTERKVSEHPSAVSTSQQSPGSACACDHIASTNSAPIPISYYCPVFQKDTKPPAIFARNMRTHSLNFLEREEELSPGQRTNLIEICYGRTGGAERSISCEVSIPLREGDIIAEVNVWMEDNREDSLQQAENEAWIFRKTSTEIYEIMACGQLSHVFRRPRLRLCSGSVSNTTNGCRCSAGTKHARHEHTDGLNLELHLDPEDTMAYAAVLGGANPGVQDFQEERQRYVKGERSFCRARFSSFATLRADGKNVDDNMQVCIHCGMDMRPVVE